MVARQRDRQRQADITQADHRDSLTRHASILT
jgi:hypothetical protein